MKRFGRLLKSAKKNGGYYRIALEMDHIAPDLSLVEFDTIEDFSISGNARFTPAIYSQVKEDIEAMRAFATFLEQTYEICCIVNYSIKDGIFDVEIKILNPWDSPNPDILRRHLESLISDTM